MAEWHEHPEFWADVGGFIFRPQVRAAADEEAAHIVRLLGIEPPTRILDLPCGVGRHAVALAKRGFNITGVDVTASYLAEAAARAAEAGVEAQCEWVRGDMRSWRREGAFDAAINIYTSFGYFQDPEDDRRVAAGYYASLRPGGRVIFEMVNKDWLLKRFQASDWHEEPDGTIVLEQRNLSGDGSWLENRWLLIRGADRREVRFGHRLYNAQDLTALLEGVGFSGVRIYGSLAGDDGGPDAPRLVVVAEKETASNAG